MEGRYKKFKIGDLFIAETGDTDLQQTDINGQGDYFINSGLQNLGIKGKTDRKAKIFPKNTITIDFWGNAFYRPFNYKLATHNHVFSLSGDIIRNEKVGLYLTAQMSYLRKFYSFNNMGTWNKIKENFIDLPVTEKEDIDFPYIEERVRELEEERVRELEAYLETCGFEDCELTEEETIALDSFNAHAISSIRIEDLFTAQTGDVDLQQKDINGKGEIFVNSGLQNLGIKGRTDRIAKIFPSNTITIDFWGYAFFRPFNYKMATHNHVFSLSGEVIKNENVGLYIVSLMSYLNQLYSFNNMGTWSKIKKNKIHIPVTSDGNIDYPFMETYINAVKKECIARLKRYIEREHKTYKKEIEA